MSTQNAVAKQQPQATRPGAMAIMAGRLSVEPGKLFSTLKSTCFKGASDDEMLALVVVANEYGLNPLLKEIYAFPAKGGGIVPVVSIDGWIKMVNRAELFDGIEFEYMESNEEIAAPPVSCTCTIYKKGFTRPVRVTEYLEECVRKTDPWDKMPRRMLRHKALIQCARVAFGFSGIQDEDEAIDVVGIVVPMSDEKPQPQRKLAPVTSEESPQAQLSALVIGAGYDFSTFQAWALDSNQIDNADSLTSFDEVPKELATRLLRAKDGLLKGLETVKGGGGK